VTYLAALNTEKPMRRALQAGYWYRLPEGGASWETDYGEGAEHCHYHAGDSVFTRADYNATDWEVSL
jgi:uncharacterized cupin superfamily protein